jgi:thiol-disulfide isomerase/thioredoxin
MNKITKTFLLVVLVVSLFTGLTVMGCSPGVGPRVGSLAPDFQLPDLSGETTYLLDLRGKPVLLNFWATWCGPCVGEMPLFQAIQDDWADDGLVILAVNSGEAAGQVVRYVQSKGYTFPVLLDTQQKVTEKYNIRGIPATFFINADGKIVDMQVGAFSRTADIEAGLKKIMPGK